MRSIWFSFLLASGLAVASGCSSDDSSDSTGDGGDTSTTSGTGGGDTTTTTTTSDGGGGSGGDTTTTSTSTSDGNDDFDSAEDMEIDAGDWTTGALDPIESDEDYFKFTGTAGEAILILTDAKPDSDEFNTEYPDVVVTLYNGDQEQIAENDDPTPRTSNDSQIYTVLPADGTYYLRVTECNVWAGSAAGCAPSEDITETDYYVAIVTVDPASDGVIADTEPNDDPTGADATVMEYAPVDGGGYYISTLYGGLSSETDVDVYSFTLPADTTVSDGRSVGYFTFFPVGSSGNGASTQIGVASIVDPETSDVIAQLDVSDGDAPGELSPPLDLDKEYLVMFTHPETAGTINDFYFVMHYGSGSNPVETDDTGNNDVAGAEELDAQDNSAGGVSYFVDGDIGEAGVDVDYYMIELPNGTDADSTVSVACGAARLGSGLTGFQFSLLTSDGSSISGASATESTSADALISDIGLPSGESMLLLKTEALLQSDTVTSTFYRCGVHVFPPQ